MLPVTGPIPPILMAAPEPAVPPDGAVDAGVLEPEPPHAASEKARQRASAALRNFFILSSYNVSNFPYTKLPTKPLIGIESILTRKMHKIQYTIFTYFSLLKRSIV